MSGWKGMARGWRGDLPRKIEWIPPSNPRICANFLDFYALAAYPTTMEFTQRFVVEYEYSVHFTRDALAPASEVLRETLPAAGAPHRCLFVVDSGLAAATPELLQRVEQYAAHNDHRLTLVVPPLVVQGGEACKNDPALLASVRAALEAGGICRHSFVVALGGGAVLDLVGYAAATVHRGVRLIRMPSTVLAQNDAGIGVKNGVNAFGTKNFCGTFAPPFSVINDLDLLRTLPRRDQRAGQAEAVKVALVRSAEFFAELEASSRELAACEEAATEAMVTRCAREHLEHIAGGGDPFELGSARPLDFGHWSAHRLEEMTNGEVRHGEAVAVGMAVDTCYAYERGLLTMEQRDRVLRLLRDLGLDLHHPELERMDLASALDSFRQHLGGALCVTLPRGIGRLVEVSEMDLDLLRRCIAWLGQQDAVSQGDDR